MTEPFLLAMPSEPEDGAWFERAPVEFRDPTRSICLVPMTTRIMASDRALYSEDEVRADPQFLKSARSNTAKNAIRRSDDGDYVSVRSSRTGMPCAAMFFLQGREKLFDAVKIDPDRYYIVFITQDEVLFADRADFQLSNIRRTTKNISNKLRSLYPDGCPILATEVFCYDKAQRKYVEA